MWKGWKIRMAIAGHEGHNRKGLPIVINTLTRLSLTQLSSFAYQGYRAREFILVNTYSKFNLHTVTRMYVMYNSRTTFNHGCGAHVRWTRENSEKPEKTRRQEDGFLQHVVRSRVLLEPLQNRKRILPSKCWKYRVDSGQNRKFLTRKKERPIENLTSCSYEIKWITKGLRLQYFSFISQYYLCYKYSGDKKYSVKLLFVNKISCWRDQKRNFFRIRLISNFRPGETTPSIGDKEKKGGDKGMRNFNQTPSFRERVDTFTPVIIETASDPRCAVRTRPRSRNQRSLNPFARRFVRSRSFTLHARPNFQPLGLHC